MITSFRLIEHRDARIVNLIATECRPSCQRIPIEEETGMSIFSTLGHLAHRYSQARARYLTERAIRTLPMELQKDIGWPDTLETPPAHSFGAGSWAGGR